MKLTDNSIIAGCQAQDPRFQKALVLRYSPILMTVARRYMSDGSAAKDVVQESFIKIIKAIPKYQSTGSFEAWMKKIVINTALQQKSLHRFKFELNGLEALPESVLPPQVYNDLAAEELIKIISSLPDGFREIFNLYAIEGYSHAEIGTLLKISESTSRSQLSRARKLLQQKLITANKIAV